GPIGRRGRRVAAAGALGRGCAIDQGGRVGVRSRSAGRAPFRHVPTEAREPLAPRTTHLARHLGAGPGGFTVNGSLAARAWPVGFELNRDALTAATIAAADCVVILTEHRTVDSNLAVDAAKLVLDTGDP